MKKFLSLALALAMTLSLVVVGASATEYDKLTDKASIKHSEAVTVMNKIGIITGYSDGSFKPEGNITRGAAAKIICMTKLGTTVANSLSCETAPFKDVAAANWAAPFVSYCSNLKIVGGYDDGTFKATNSVTGYAFAKMLLTSLGVTGTYTGNGWEINVAAAAQKIGLFDGIDETVVMSKALSRDNACQMALNAMNYSATGSTVFEVIVKYADGTNANATSQPYDFNTASEALSFYAVMKQQVSAATADGTINTVTYVGETTSASSDTLLKTVFGVVRNIKNSDDFGRPATTYTKGTSWTLTFNGTPVKTYKTAVTAAKLFSDLNGYKKQITINNNNTTKEPSTNVITPVAGDTTNVTGGKGILTEVYNIGSSSSPNYVAVQVAPKFAQVATTKTAATTAKGAFTTYTVGGQTGVVFSSVVDKAADVDTAVVTGTVANGDYVEYYYDRTQTLHIDAVSTVDGILTAKSSDGVFTIGGKSYEAVATGVATVDPAIKSTSQTFFVDANGYLLGTKDTSSSVYDYAYVVKTADVTTLTGTTLNTVLNATLAYPDGSVKTVAVVDSTGEAMTATNGQYAAAKAQAGKVVSLTSFSAGIQLSTVTADGSVGVSAELTTLTKGTNKLADNFYADNNTKFVYVDLKSDGTTPTGTVTVKTGINNIDTLSTTEAYAVDLQKTADHVVDVVYIYTTTVSNTSEFTYITGSWNQTSDGYVVNTFTNGKAGTLTLAAAPTAGLYKTVVVTGKTLTATAADKLQVTTTDVKGVKVVGGLLYTTTDGTNYAVYAGATTPANGTNSVISVGSTVPMYEISSDANTCTAVTDASVAVAGTVYVQMNSTQTAITAIYVVHA